MCEYREYNDYQQIKIIHATDMHETIVNMYLCRPILAIQRKICNWKTTGCRV